MIVRVLWDDAISDEGTFHKDQTDSVTTLRVTSVGELWFDDDEKVVIARDTFAEGNYRGIITIPRKRVIDMQVIFHGTKVGE